jgi:hypothetical protein
MIIGRQQRIRKTPYLLRKRVLFARRLRAVPPTTGFSQSRRGSGIARSGSKLLNPGVRREHLSFQLIPRRVALAKHHTIRRMTAPSLFFPEILDAIDKALAAAPR